MFDYTRKKKFGEQKNMQRFVKGSHQINVIIFIILLAYIILFSYFFHFPNQIVRKSNRIGFGISTKADPIFWSKELNASWYLDWKTTPIDANKNPEYWQMIRLSNEGFKPSEKEIIQIAINYPGHTWIIGNEPDNRYQDNIDYSQFTKKYHYLYYLVKKYDPTSKIAIGAISQPTPLRLQYLDLVLAEYQKLFNHNLPVDWWTLHAYVLREEKDSWGADIPTGFPNSTGTLYEIEQHGDISIFKANILNFRSWMKKNGYQNIPLAITEFGILLPKEFGFSSDKVADYLSLSFDWLSTAKDKNLGFSQDDYHIVQKYAWFSLGDTIYPVADLVDFSKMELTRVGDQFRKSSSLINQ